MFCPIDGKACCDDLCHGGGCIQTGFAESMEDLCSHCGQLFPNEEVIYGVCIECRSDYENDEDEEIESSD